MTIQPGTDISRYHILEQVGESSITVAYKALNTHLESEVVLKFLRTGDLPPNSLPRILKRFHIEVKQIAQLQHPSIVSITDFGEYEGAPYLVIPYLPGGTLKSRLGQPMSWKEAACLLRPIADALGYAHSKGVLHGDLKPANILITETGEPMLTGFGITTILSSEDIPNLNAQVGTPEYMAPEQAQGKAIDERTDVYSLGIVFYEMVTGDKPFTADTPMGVIVKQMRDPLPQPSQFMPDLPDEVEYLLIKSLAKDPQERYQNMAELAQALGKLLAEDIPASKEKERNPLTHPAKKDLVIPSQEIPTSQEKEKQKKFVVLSWLPRVIVVVLAVLVIYLVSLSVGHFSKSSTTDGSQTGDSLVASQACQIVFASTRDGDYEIFVMEVDGSNPTQLTFNDSNDDSPDWSPDGNYIAFESDRDGDDEIFVMDADGSNPTQLTFNDSADWEPSWSSDRKRIAFVSGGGGDWNIFVKNVDGSNLTQLTNNERNTEEILPSFAWAPDGKRIAFDSFYDGDWEIFLIAADGSDRIRLTINSSTSLEPAWSPDGKHITFFSDRDGDHEIFVIDADGSNPTQLTYNDSIDWTPAWSPDGKYIIYISNRDGDPEIYKMDADGSNQTQLTFNDSDDQLPAWSPNGKRIAFVSERDGDGEIFVMDADGNNQTQLTFNDSSDWMPGWSPLCATQ